MLRVIVNIFRMERYVSGICDHFSIGFIDNMPARKSPTDCTSLVSP